MTITYSLDVSQARFLGFAKLLARWRGSIYQILWREFAVFCAGYAAISLTYRCLLDDQQRASFERVVLWAGSLIDLIPLSFVLGFYVTLVIGRWWAQYDAIPWPDRLCLMVAAYVHGSDERSRSIRRTLGRYLILLQALTFQAVSTAVKKRFPTTRHLVAAGVMTAEERSVYERINFPYGKWWVPCQWFVSLLARARKEGRIKEPVMLDGLFRELLAYRNQCGTMLSYDWISVPLVYTQVVTLATYVYAATLMVGRQYLDASKGYAQHGVDLYVPVFTMLQFFFYVGWLKVAEQIVNPYGEDDDDFELNWCLDRTVHVVYLIVDHLQTKHPKVRRDCFWDDPEPKLPHTKHSASENPQLGSAFNLEVEDAKYLPMDTLLEQDKEENMYTSDSVRRTMSAGGFRTSFLMRVLNPALGQSFRKKSVLGKDSSKGRHQSAVSTPAASRKSSFRSFIRRSSPSNSRASSVSFVPGSVNRRRNKSHEQEDDKSIPANGILPNQDSSRLSAFQTVPQDNSSQLVKNPATRQHEEGFSCNDDKAGDDSQGQRAETLMPPIPEEESRPTSFENTDGESVVDLPVQPEMDDVQNLVKEANEVLKELNRTISAQGHRNDCELRGYESCCSFSSDASSEEDDRDHLSDEVDQKTSDNHEPVIVIQGDFANQTSA